jgi:hypothetical protein
VPPALVNATVIQPVSQPEIEHDPLFFPPSASVNKLRAAPSSKTPPHSHSFRDLYVPFLESSNNFVSVLPLAAVLPTLFQDPVTPNGPGTLHTSLLFIYV